MDALSYIHSVDLSGTPRGIVTMDAATDAGPVFEKAKRSVAGRRLYCFFPSPPPSMANIREAISDSALLAQLVANKQTDSQSDPLAWFSAYTKVLQNVGWVVQDSGFTDYDAGGTGVEVNQEIITVMSVALGNGAGRTRNYYGHCDRAESNAAGQSLAHHLQPRNAERENRPLPGRPG